MFPFCSEETGVERLSSSLKFIELVSATGVPAQAAEQEREPHHSVRGGLTEAGIFISQPLLKKRPCQMARLDK